MTLRSFNFNAGPAAMPLAVLESIRRDLVDYKGRGLSVMEMSHRSADFVEIAEKAESDLRTLLAVPQDYSVLFMQGGASAQFALTVQNLDKKGEVAFANTGYWSRKAISVAALTTRVREVATLNESPTRHVPSVEQWGNAEGVSYLHVTDNETIDGVQLSELPAGTTPLVCDMSSSILSKPIDINRYDLIYAGAQKNIGPAGITVVIAKDALIEDGQHNASLAPAFSYKAMRDAGSMLNTPPTFAWYAAGLVFQWLLDEGGLSAIYQRNKRQAEKVYKAIDESPVFTNTIHEANRSIMNIPFQLVDPTREKAFLSGCQQRQIIGLKGHKSVGGLRASLYNAVTDESVDALTNYIDEFAKVRAT